jgi:glycosyltransferase involved in cell wall biosynthesis
MTSIVIAAHNEEAVIGHCLDALHDQAAPGELDITVVCNGCTDGTVAVATRPGVRVLTLPEAGKAAALNAGDAVARGFPRIYLDADVELAPGTVRALVAALAPAGAPKPPLAVVPRRKLDLARRPLIVRAYYTVNARHPAYRDSIFGRGVVAVSEPGRSRFDRFPEMIADDLFLDSHFTANEKREVPQAIARIAAARRTRDLLRRLVRVRAGNVAMRAANTGVRQSAWWAWLRDVVVPRPWLAPAGIVYVVLTVAAEVAARRASPASAMAWGRDESSRTATPIGRGSR